MAKVGLPKVDFDLLNAVLHPAAGDLDLTEERVVQDGHEDELDPRVPPPLYSEADRRFREWENVVFGLARITL